ncbi:hypothetical protein [Bradyrhizobium sp. NP1]|uniref:hypothetical protein n=1 Tax=Bradyrhizobium sp. NP1 TaxID=3049772 RepID=UPI0025A507F0|nr:hypothetical protein [Bradyrhizobium sp. NP1]WJR74821.1 hypothetical protein QOU61_18480 [Bradyrhizobium sp. NP1]
MALQRAYRAAVGGKHRGSKAGNLVDALVMVRRLSMAAAVFFVAASFSSTAHAQAGPFAGMAGSWAGSGTVTLDDGSRERIRCRATYAVSGPNMNMTLTCASDAYKFNLQASVVDEGGAVTGNWTESSRNVAGTLQGRGGGGRFEVLASAAGFNANIALRTAGGKQSIAMRADSQFRAADITLSR